MTLTLLFLTLWGGPPAFASANCSEANFRVAQHFDMESVGQSFVVADFNGDGRPDIAASAAADVQLRLNDGTGWFGTPVSYDTVGVPGKLEVGDFNGDGRTDLVVTHPSNSHVSLLTGDGAGGFSTLSNFEVGARTLSAVAGDFNGDGKLDVAVAYLGAGDAGFVSVLLGDGAGVLLPAGAVPVNGVPGTLVSDDFDKDGKRDLALHITDTRTFVDKTLVYSGDGAGGFVAPRTVMTGSVRHLITADFNADGRPDLAAAIGDAVTIMRGDGEGNFSVATPVAVGPLSAPVYLTSLDLNGDGRADLVAVFAGWSSVGVLFNDGAGGFSAPRTFGVGAPAYQVAAADFDGDGTDDLAVGTGLGAFGTTIGFVVMRGLGAGDFNAPRTLPVNTAPQISFPRKGPGKIALADFNNDGRTDLAVSNGRNVSIVGGSATVSVLLADGAGGFTAAPEIIFFQGTEIGPLAAADFNSDGKADLAVTIPSDVFGRAHTVAVYLGHGDGGFTAHSTVRVFTPNDIEAADINNDSKPDLLVKRDSNFVALINDGAANFTSFEGPAGGPWFADLTTGDFNKDGKLDVAVTDFHNGKVLVTLGAGNGIFDFMRQIDVGAGPLAVTFADFNADGIQDMATTRALFSNQGFVSILLGTGTGLFGPPTSYEIGAQPESVAVGDFNGDGRADLVSGDLFGAGISVLTGNGDGTFRPRVSFVLDSGPAHVVVHDFNADGKPDLGVSQTNVHTVALLMNNLTTPLPCLSVADATFAEGNAGESEGEFVVTLSEASDKTVKVNYFLGGFPATPNEDFRVTRGSLTFAPGETSRKVKVTILGDVIDEDAESFRLTLRSPSNALIHDGQALGTILNDDPAPTISVADASAPEGNSGFPASALGFNVTLSAPSSRPITVQYVTSNGTATDASDYFHSTGTVEFGPGQTTKTVQVLTKSDTTRESDETFTLTLSNPTNATLGDGVALGTILNDDPVPTLSVVNSSANEGASAGVVTVRVRLSNPTERTVTVVYGTADATARAGSDYAPASGTLTFNPGEVEKTFDVTIINDAEDEAEETFNVLLANPTEANAPAAPGVFTIFDNDGPTISVNDVAVAEGQSGRTFATFTLTLSAPSPQFVAVRVATADGTADGTNFPADFQHINPNFGRFVEFAPGTTTATLTVLVNGDQMIEPDETFFVNLSEPGNATIADGQGLGTITNDDVTSVQFSTSAAAVNEADGKVQLTVMRVGDLSGVFTAVYTTFNGTASERSDFNAVIGALRFEPNEATKTITVFITNDALVEGPEDFFVALFGAEGGATNPPSFVTVTINSDDAVPGPNPLDDANFFVRQHYLDFFSREPDAGGLAHWTNVADNCGDSDRLVCRINVSAAFFLSIEFTETGFLVERAYKAAYGDATGTSTLGGTPHTLAVPIIRFDEFLPDTQRIGSGVVILAEGWEAKLESNKQAYFLEFVRGSRFMNAYPATMTPTQFVDQLNARAGNPLDAAERQALINELTNNNTTAGRASVLRKVAEDATLADAEKNRAFVLMQYFGYLRRDPNELPDVDYTGYDFWLGNLNRFNGNFVHAELVKAFITSDEYRHRFGQ
ncbi:MAG TPA: FG-GAP-like repeat-containing protein [Pyrinomonadaceae bacterium]|nr:FG-GAP-like repeat-containing protein [Pyrinomonadaceae bacterium]